MSLMTQEYRIRLSTSSIVNTENNIPDKPPKVISPTGGLEGSEANEHGPGHLGGDAITVAQSWHINLCVN